MPEAQQPSVWTHLLITLISVAGAAALIWMELPPSQRMMVSLTVRQNTYRVLHRAARAAGRWGMSSELADHFESMSFGYAMAYRLARLRDRV